ncbi:hypothetical protein [Sutcliffiella rhizosphaerae]|uniref:Uncharacterized protein n=1 Tax=Sutcliffiella rhizosphaerae TaxID=2880967 RepID=A0ABM8YM57_9BACI|nr:hypothetical protein [Sutcliffiella rhizosphaerae]CAG9621048.1 hypothetical protein BACCIP111883_01820 [Sutcliffiella rhizosphaerae]
MRIDLYFHDYKDKSETNRTIEVLNIFLNQQIVMNNYSSVYNSISFKFLNNPSKKREAKVRLPYGVHPEVEILSTFNENEVLSVETFQHALQMIQEAVVRIPEAPSKEEFDFDVEGLIKDIMVATKNAPSSVEALKYLENNQKKLTLQNRTNFRLRVVENFRKDPRPLDTELIGVRIADDFFYKDEEVGYYKNMLEIIISDVLRRYDILLPRYQEIFLELVGSLEESTEINFQKDDWFQYTPAIFDYEKFKQSSKPEKEQIFIDSLIYGLRYITDFDHLEKEKMESAIGYIQKHKLQTPLIYMTKENEEYEVNIQYKVTSIVGNLIKANYDLYIRQKASGEERVLSLGTFQPFFVPYALGTIRLTKKQVTIKGRSGLRAEIYRMSEKAPSEHKFQFQELFGK